MSSQNRDGNIPPDYASDFDSTRHQSQFVESDPQTLNLPKVRRDAGSRTGSINRGEGRKITPNAVPATPRMLRNASKSASITNQDSLSLADTAVDETSAAEWTHRRQPSSNSGHTEIPVPQDDAVKKLLPGVSFENSSKHQGQLNQRPDIRTPNRQASLGRRPSGYRPTGSASASKDGYHGQTTPQTQQQQPTQSQSPQLQPPSQPQQQFHRRSIGDWEFTKTIGAGSMGKVKLARHRVTNELCAVKVVPRASKLWQRQQKDAPPTSDPLEMNKRRKELEKEIARDKRTIREGALGRLMYHPYICRLYEMIPMTNHYYMLFEYVSGGQMLDYIVSHGSLKERHARKFSRGIASALDYCHSNNIVHRDLKIENIMINKNGEIKLIDFGLSNMFDRLKLLKTYCGSLYFAAPELLSAHPYLGPEVDVWSFGVVLYVLVCGRVPFDDQSVSALHEKIKRGHVEYPDHLSKECISILSKMLVVDPEKRATLRSIMAHPWMVKGFEGPPSSYLPRRVPLQLPLDPEIIGEMSNLEFGPQEQVIHDMTEILSSSHYRASVAIWFQQHPELNVQPEPGLNPITNYIDPTSGYHPLISIYYLVDEMKQRKRAKLEASRSQVQQIQSLQDYRQRQSEQEKLYPGGTPSKSTHQRSSSQLQQHNTPVIPYPKAAYASPHQQQTQQRPPSSPIANDHSLLEAMPVQQSSKSQSPSRQRAKTYTGIEQHLSGSPSSTTDSPSGKAGFNALFRKLSARRPSRATAPAPTLESPTAEAREPVPPVVHPILPELNTSVEDEDAASVHSHTSSVRRVGSVKVTNKEKQQLQQQAELPPLPVTSRLQIQQHQRAVSAQVSSLDQETTSTAHTTTPNTHKMHPSARAKSVGHARKNSLTFPKFAYNSNAEPQVPALPNSYNDEDFFDDVTIDENDFKSKDTNAQKELTEDQIIAQFERALPGSMPSIEYPKTLFLKGFFSVQTTSTKPLPIIRYDIISVLTKLGVRFNEVPGGFVCIHTPSIEPDRTSPSLPSATVGSIEGVSPTKTDSNGEGLKSLNINQTSNTSSGSSEKKKDDSLSAWETSFSPTVTPVSTPNTKTHRRKFSVDSSLFGSHRKKSDKIASSVGKADSSMPMTPAGANVRRSSTSYSYESGEESMDSLHEGRGGSDMLVSSRVEQQTRVARSPSLSQNPQAISAVTEGTDKVSRSNTIKERTPLRFEIHIVKVPLVGLYGVQFKKLTGNTWMYKALAGQILSELNL
ncbi:unnamed protein product [Kuraishia capsulata CBS 1993]|uniref:non-specific serine/threonine protein kinase n=1 Tax=Kuraishia capsulata CBS 1993 TaxID=1382522 RepID=W6MU17_9ASCO|nr:uncharacterized protein KUCA_T00004802001 [Kuraishia capsulata CBS 1993]CDK28817.1 unnamed protein product [Kuraishia capsulata CBS 1993]